LFDGRTNRKGVQINHDWLRCGGIDLSRVTRRDGRFSGGLLSHVQAPQFVEVLLVHVQRHGLETRDVLEQTQDHLNKLVLRQCQTLLFFDDQQQGSALLF